MSISRRGFLKAGAGGAAVTALGLRTLRWVGAERARRGLTGSSTVRSTCSPNCTGACGYDALVVDGRIATLIQAADYPEPEYNPRGCLRGLSMMTLVYGADRLKHPLIRTGERGRGEFRRASWDEALDYTARSLRRIMDRHGSTAVAATIQVPGTGYVQKGAWVRLAALAHWTMHHGYDQNGDLPMFWPMTFGVQTEELESLEWRNARTTIVFGSNPIKTRLPDAQHLIAARRGGSLIVVDPDYSSTAMKADEWLPARADTDTALALGMARVIVDRRLHDVPFLQQFTDMPLLVRRDTGRRLRASEVPGLAEAAAAIAAPAYRDVFVAQRDDGELMAVDPTRLDPISPRLEGRREVELADGTRAEVETVWDQLRRLLDDYPLSRVEELTGVPAAQVERVAVRAATSGPLHVVYGASGYQWYHADLKGRAISLLAVLTGNLGRPGAGISTLAGQYRIRFDLSSWWGVEGGRINWVPYLHFLRGDGINMPESGIRAMVTGWGNPFDQHNMADVLRERATSGELEFLLTTDFQMTTTAAWSDVVLPAASWYEKIDLTATPLHPYLQLQQPAIEPLFESRSELWIARELAKRLDPSFERHYLPELGEREAAEAVIERLLEHGGAETRGITLAQLRAGPVRLHSGAPGDRQIPFWEQVNDRVPFPPRSYPAPLEATARFVRSGRVELYREEDVFRETGEQLPVHKATYEETEYRADPEARDRYRLRFVTKNSVYRVHSTHSNNPWMLELQGDRARVWLHPDDARERRLEPGELVEVYNGRGRARAHLALDPGCHRGSCVFEQGWWSRYLDGTSYNSLTMYWTKPAHELRDYFVPGIWSPSTAWNECLVDVRRVET